MRESSGAGSDAQLLGCLVAGVLSCQVAWQAEEARLRKAADAAARKLGVLLCFMRTDAAGV